MITTNHPRLILGVLLGAALPLALAACGVKVNGKSYGPGGGGTSSGGGGSTATPGGGETAAAGGGGTGGGDAGDSASPGDSDQPQYAPAPTACYQGNKVAPPYSLTPVDPWIAVQGDRPASVTNANLPPRADADCSALHDHCLRECAWHVASTGDLDTTPTDANVMSPRATQGWGGRDISGTELRAKSAFRTVPATRRHLTPGAIVVALPYPTRLPTGEADGMEVEWSIGTLDRVDWKAGKMFMVGSSNPFWLSVTRVAVLSYREGGKVEILAGRKRTELAVRPDELFLPLADVASASAPWSQVGTDGQPLVVEDRRPFETAKVTCGPANDHCLRPWVWLVDLGGGNLWPAKFDGKAFRSTKAIDQLEELDGVRGAYRSTPAGKDTLKVGATVYVFGGSDERSVHTSPWSIVTVTKIRPDGTFEGDHRSGSSLWKIDHARVPVVFWYPGERAEKVE